MSLAPPPSSAFQAVPDLTFRIEGAESTEYAAAPSIRFLLRVAAEPQRSIRSLQLNVQVRIVPGQRGYTAEEQRRLIDLFGLPDRWATSLQSLLWTQASVTVPPFMGATAVDVAVPCTYDFEVAGARYMHGLREGEIPLEFLFSGTVFYADGDGALRTGRISWEREARYRLPVEVWRRTMDQYFPNAAWLRVRRDVFDRLVDYRATRSLPTWEAALESLLASAEEEG